MKKTTISDIANKLDITASTVSRALSNHPRISDATKKAVLEMAEKLNYQPNNIASALRKGKSNIIGVIVPTTDRKFFASIIKGIEEVLNEKNYNLIISQSDEQYAKEKSNIDALLQVQVDGIIASVSKETTDYEHFKKIKNRGIPLILYDRTHESLEASAVVIDDYLGAYKAVNHLIEQGCTRIAHFSGPQYINIYKERLRGYKEALSKHNIPVEEELILESKLQLESGRRLADELLELSSPPDGIFSSSDFAAMGAMQVLKENNILIPEDMAVVGFSNDSFTPFIEPSLTTVDQQTKQMGKFAAQLFLEESSAEQETFAPRKTVLTPELIVRSSSLRHAS